MLPVPTVEYLAVFTGRDVLSFSPFAEQALAQATLLFSITTRREEYPDDVDQRQLAVNAILEMADRILLGQPYQSVTASPFVSETIGSYSYSKMLSLIKENRPTGLFWWDLAIEELSLVSRSLVNWDSVSVLENDSMYVDTNGRRVVLGPHDFALPDVPFDVNAETRPRNT